MLKAGEKKALYSILYLYEPAGNSGSIVLYGLCFLFVMVSHSLLWYATPPPFPPPALCVTEFIPSGRRTTSGHTHTHAHTHTRKCCSSGSCELQCCSLIQGKCQTQEKSFKYRHFQSFCFLWQPLRSPGTSPCLGTGPAQLHGLCSRSSRCQEKTGPCHTWGCIIWYQNALCWHSV